MSQRNPMNDRYQTDEHQGQTRKSAASMKPKSKAASTVRIQSTVKTKQEKKAAQKADRAKQTQLDRKYYNPPTAQYKRLRKIWWGLLITAIVCTALSFLGRAWLPDAAAYVILGLAYVCIISALYVDFSKIRKVRRAYQEAMESSKSKEQRALEKQQKAAQKAAELAEAEKAEADKAVEAEKPKRRSLFGSGFRLNKAEKAKDEKQAAKEEKTAEKAKPAKQQDAADKENTVFKRAKADARGAVDSQDPAK